LRPLTPTLSRREREKEQRDSVSLDAFVLNGTSYSRQQLLDGCPQAQVSDYERRVLDFCQHWLSGQETFTLQTSGSTGQPKTILLTRAQMVTSAHWTAQALGLAPGDRALVEEVAGLEVKSGVKFDGLPGE